MRPGMLDANDILPNGRARKPLSVKPDAAVEPPAEIAWPTADFVARAVVACCQVVREDPIALVRDAKFPMQSLARPLAVIVIRRQFPDLSVFQVAGMLGGARRPTASLAVAVERQLDRLGGWLNGEAGKIRLDP